jgi:hypothetical protein
MLAATLLLVATSAEAVQLHFEAWPAPSSETCTAPCYQVRMFLQVEPSDSDQDILAIQMNVDVRSGAVPAQLPVHPQRNSNAGSGNIQIGATGTATVNVPWDLSSAVAKSPLEGFDATLVHAADVTFTVGGLADLLDDPSTSCVDDVSKCAFVLEALEKHRIYLGFFNVTERVSHIAIASAITTTQSSARTAHKASRSSSSKSGASRASAMPSRP